MPTSTTRRRVPAIATTGRRAAPPAASPTGYPIQIFSRHPSHAPLRRLLPRLPFRATVRFGSTKPSVARTQLNSPEAVTNSADKLLMKQRFQQAGMAITTAAWTHNSHVDFATKIRGWFTEGFKVVMKNRHGSRGQGLYLLSRWEDIATHNHSGLENYVFEKFYDYSREYRLHVTKDGCFYTNRKLLKDETPEDQRWYRNDSNCNWILQTNPSFNQPVNWNQIVAQCVSALRAVGLDIGAFDVKVQSANDNHDRRRATPAFIILECNSAPSHGDGTRAHYLREIPRLLREKHNS